MFVNVLRLQSPTPNWLKTLVLGINKVLVKKHSSLLHRGTKKFYNMDLGCFILWRHGNQHNGIQHNDIQHNDIQHNKKHFTQHKWYVA